jgi:hypothetical protein
MEQIADWSNKIPQLANVKNEIIQIVPLFRLVLLNH